MTLFTAACAALAFVAPVIQTSSPSTSVDAVKRRLVGTWKLAKYEIFDERGAARPGGFDAGRIMYGDSGEMTAHLLRTGGSTAAATTEATRAAAFQSYRGYFGPYTIDPSKQIVVHHVVGSSRPDWIGSEQVRHFALSEDGNQLTLSLKSGERITQTLTWDRIR